MQRLLAIVWLTWKAAFRYRLFWVLALLLAGAVVLLPLLIKDDGTARGFTQILITYTLGTITALLGFATLWLSCGTLAREIEDCQMQLVAVKPIARWQIWVGKWLGIVTLDAVLLAICGVCIAGLLQWRARQLPAKEQAILKNEILVARGSIKEELPDIDNTVERVLRDKLRDFQGTVNTNAVRADIREQVKSINQVVPQNNMRRWTINLGATRFFLKDQPLYLRTKFYAAETNANKTYLGIWEIGPTASPSRWRTNQSLAAETFHEFAIPANLFDDKGTLVIDFQNRNPIALMFPLEEGMEVLYREGSFGLNFARGLAIILCWLGLLTALGLATASLLSFPVAAFTSASLLLVSFSSGTLSNAVESGTLGIFTDDKGAASTTALDMIIIPLFKLMLSILNLLQGFSPVDALSTGRSITWTTVGLAVLQIVILTSGVFAVAGIILFNRRELAAAQGQS